MHLVVALSVILIGVRSLPVENVDRNEPCGVEASTNPIHRNPWTVFLEYYKEDERTATRCGGTLIGRRHVLTAAHCVKAATFTSLTVRLGEYDTATERDCVRGVCAGAAVRVDVTGVSIPESFDGTEDDIAVLELAEDAPYTDFIRPACLPTATTESPLTFTASGWGQQSTNHLYSHIKKDLSLPQWSIELCKNAYSNLVLPSKIICAGGVEHIDTCTGDSGGPLTLLNGRVEIWGVTSSGNENCGTKDYPGIYTSVSDHLEWLMKVLNEI